jgi:hypothetical protein
MPIEWTTHVVASQRSGSRGEILEIQLDFEAAQVRFLSSQRIKRESLGRPCPLTVPRGVAGYVYVRENATGSKGLRPLIDTGALVDGLLDPQEFKLELRTQRAARTNQNSSMGFDRCSAFFPKVLFAGETYTNVILDRSPGLRVGGKTYHLNAIGLPFLARHLVTLDFPNQVMYLQRRTTDHE